MAENGNGKKLVGRVFQGTISTLLAGSIIGLFVMYGDIRELKAVKQNEFTGYSVQIGAMRERIDALVRRIDKLSDRIDNHIEGHASIPLNDNKAFVSNESPRR